MAALLDEDALAVVAKLAEAEVSRVLAARGTPDKLEAELVRVEAKVARLVDLAAEGNIAADAVRAKLGALEAERRQLQADLDRARASKPAAGAVEVALWGALERVAALLHSDTEGSRDGLRALLADEPLRVVASEAGHQLEGALELKTGGPTEDRRSWLVAGAMFEHFLLDVELPWAA